MMLFALAMTATFLAGTWTIGIGTMNFIEDTLGSGFVGSTTIAGAWLIAAMFWLAWAFS